MYVFCLMHNIIYGVEISAGRFIIKRFAICFGREIHDIQ